MISLGDVNFALGADTRDLQRSVTELRRFGSAVDAVQTSTTRSADQVAAAFRKQEQAIVGALNSTLRLQQQMRKVDGGAQFANEAGRAFRDLNTYMTAGQRTTLEYQRAMERFRTSTQNATRGFKDFTVAQTHVNGLAHSMKGLQSSMVLIQGPLGGLATRVSTISSLMGEAGAKTALFVAGFATAGVGVYKFGQQLLDAGKQVNSFMGQFTAVTGNTDQAVGLFEKVTKIARQTGQQIQDLAPMFARFTIAANGTGLTMEQVERAFTIVASAGTKLQMSQEQSMGTFRALEQMMSKGTIQAEELRGQLGDRLPGAVSIMARALGVTTSELQKMMKEGNVLTASALPKFIEELARTLNIDSKPIDNYTAAVNNNTASWFQLRAELDKQFGVTDKVISLYKSVTDAMDSIRVNLDEVRKAAIVAGAALVGVATPAILGSILSLVKAFGSLTKSMLLFNTAAMANPLFAAGKIALMVAGAVAALYPFRDELKLIEGDIASVGDYFDEIWERIAGKQTTALDALAKSWDQFRAAVNDIARSLGSDWELNWINVGNVVINIFADIVNTVRSATTELVLLMDHMFNNIMADLQSVGGAMNSVRHWISPWVDEPKADAAGNQITKGMDWYETLFKDKSYEWRDWQSFQRRLKAALTNTPEYKAPFNAEDLRAGANRRGLERIYNDPSRGQDIMQPGGWPSTPPFQLDPANDNAETTETETKALKKKSEALKDINDELTRVYREMSGLQQTEAELNRLNEQFDREEKVERYAEALRKAGVDTATILAKTNELATALETRDMFARQRESVILLRDSMVEGFDQMGQSILDAFRNGEDAGQAFLNAVKNVVNDVLDMIIKLTLLNPLKNWLFGTDLPTIDSVGGLAGAFSKALPGLFGSATPTVPFGTPTGLMDMLNRYPDDPRASGWGLMGSSAGVGVDTMTTGSTSTGGGMPSVADMTAYIRQMAPQFGVNANTALTVARHEGLAPGVWQSNLYGGKLGLREPSYGPFQLLRGGNGTGFGQGLGNAFERQTGLDVTNPGTWKQQIQFALGQAQKGGWTPWYGAKAAGVSKWEGIDRGATPAAMSAFSKDINASSTAIKAANSNIDKLSTSSGSAADGLGEASSGLKNFGNGLNNFGGQLSNLRLGGGGGGGGGGGFSIGGLLGGSGGDWFSGGGSGLFDWGFMDGGGHVLGNVITADWASIFSGFHFGGTVGYGSGMSRRVNPGVFAGAPRYHSGGIAGLAPDEVPIIAQKGEKILPKGKSSANGNVRINSTVINNTGSKVNTSQKQNSDGSIDLITTVDEVVADRLSRNGTMSNKTLRRNFGARTTLRTR